MNPLQTNPRLQDHMMYALDWAIYLRHNITDPVIPFLFEWKEEKLFMNMLQSDGDPEEYAYKVAQQSKREADQFAVGYEGVLTDTEGQKSDAFIIKAYDKTMPNGVFLAQVFSPKEKGGFQLIGKPMLVDVPELPMPIDSTIKPNYESDELFFQGIVMSDEKLLAFFGHENPSVVSDSIKRYVRGKLSDANSSDLGGSIELQVNPVDNANDFYKYTVTRAVHDLSVEDSVKKWEVETGKKLVLTLKYDKAQWYPASDSKGDMKTDSKLHQPSSSSSKQAVKQTKEKTNTTKSKHEQLVDKFSKFDKKWLDSEFYRIASIPNARTNVDALEQMSALIEVYEAKGIEMPSASRQASSSGGCASVIVFCIVATAVLLDLL